MKKKCKNFVAMGSEHVTCWGLVRLIELPSRENGWMEKQLKNKKEFSADDVFKKWLFEIIGGKQRTV